MRGFSTSVESCQLLTPYGKQVALFLLALVPRSHADMRQTMWRAVGITAFVAAIFSATYAVMSSSLVDGDAGAATVIAHVLVVVIGVLGASLLGFVVISAVMTGEIPIWMTVRASRHGQPLEYWCSVGLHAACSTALLILAIRSVGRLASWSL